MLLASNNVDIGTAAAPITIHEEKHNPSVVKAIVAWEEDKPKGRALYFTRATAPSGEGPLFHHIGLYAYRRSTRKVCHASCFTVRVARKTGAVASI